MEVPPEFEVVDRALFAGLARTSLAILFDDLALLYAVLQPGMVLPLLDRIVLDEPSAFILDDFLYAQFRSLAPEQKRRLAGRTLDRCQELYPHGWNLPPLLVLWLLVTIEPLPQLVVLATDLSQEATVYADVFGRLIPETDDPVRSPTPEVPVQTLTPPSSGSF